MNSIGYSWHGAVSARPPGTRGEGADAAEYRDLDHVACVRFWSWCIALVGTTTASPVRSPCGIVAVTGAEMPGSGFGARS